MIINDVVNKLRVADEKKLNTSSKKNLRRVEMESVSKVLFSTPCWQKKTQTCQV